MAKVVQCTGQNLSDGMDLGSAAPTTFVRLVCVVGLIYVLHKSPTQNEVQRIAPTRKHKSKKAKIHRKSDVGLLIRFCDKSCLDPTQIAWN